MCLLTHRLPSRFAKTYDRQKIRTISQQYNTIQMIRQYQFLPKDAAFQKRVLRACLDLLEAESGPVLKDYPEVVPADMATDEMIGMA